MADFSVGDAPRAAPHSSIAALAAGPFQWPPSSSSTSASTSSAFALPSNTRILPKWGRNLLRMFITAAGTALVLLMLWDEEQVDNGSLERIKGNARGGGWSFWGLGGGSSSNSGSSGSGGGRIQRSHTAAYLMGQGPYGSAMLPVDDGYIYTPEGMAFDAWKRLPQELLTPLTAEAQTIIYQHQHPLTCEGKRFLVSHGNDADAGMGSHVHISGMHLGMALELGRIFLWADDIGIRYTDTETCSTKSNLECFFRSPSNCTLYDALQEGAGDVIHAYYGLAGNKYKLSYSFTPSVFKSLWAQTGSPITFHEMKYWWRAQSVAYLMRFNDNAIKLMRELRTGAGKMVVWPGSMAETKDGPGFAFAEKVKGTFPLPRGAVSMHVRHGDKAIEMKLVEDRKYFDAGEHLVSNNPLRLSRVAFISTEDPQVMESAKGWSLQPGRETGMGNWAYTWYDVPRVNSNGLDQIGKLAGQAYPKGVLTHIWWLQLLIALECDAWVGTRGSNWNRLIDELRCIWVPKCPNSYVEVGEAEDWHNYNW